MVKALFVLYVIGVVLTALPAYKASSEVKPQEMVIDAGMAFIISLLWPFLVAFSIFFVLFDLFKPSTGKRYFG